MQSKISIALHSVTFWLMLGTFSLAGLMAIMPQLDGSSLLVVTALVAGLSAILHPNEVQKAGNFQK